MRIKCTTQRECPSQKLVLNRGSSCLSSRSRGYASKRWALPSVNNKLLGAVAVSALALAGLASPTAAQAPSRDAFWKHVQEICNATSNVKTIEKIEPHAEEIAAA